MGDLDATGTTTSVSELMPGLRVGIGDTSGTLSFRTDGALHLETRETDGPYEWAEISISLADPAWHLCRRIHFQITVCATLPVEVMPALRLFSVGQFHDLFPAAPIPVYPETIRCGCVFDLIPRQMVDIERMDLQLFLSNQEHQLTVFDMSVVGTH
ncbi:MAG: hypothetical protein AAGF36_08125 [Pseudomonadota bacterium]